MLQKKINIPANDIYVDLDQLDEILLVLRNWYGIEVDHWICSEASKYSVIMRVTNFSQKRYSKHLLDYFKSVVEESSKLKSSADLKQRMLQGDGLVDFVDSKVFLREDSTGDATKSVLEIRRILESCRTDIRIKNWLLFAEERTYKDCTIELTMLFEPFGDGSPRNEITLHLRISNDNQVVIVGFESSKKKFTYFGFLKNGLHIYKDINERILRRRRTGSGKFSEYFDPMRPNWFSFPCEDDAEAIILDGLNRTLGIESTVEDNIVHFKLDETEIPGLISYFWIGLPQAIFVLPDVER